MLPREMESNDVAELKKSSKEMAQILEAQRAEIAELKEAQRAESAELKAMIRQLMETILVDSKV